MNGARTFQTSQEVLSYLQKLYGSVDWQSWQSLRKQWWSYVTYLEAGATEFSLFADAQGSNSTTIEDTNMPKANSFGQTHFWLRAIRCKWYIKTWDLTAFDGLDASTLASDLINGFIHAGVLTLDINGRRMLEIPRPFLYCPPANGQPVVKSAGVQSITLTEGTPNTLLTHVAQIPYARQAGRERGLFVVDPGIFFEAEVNFDCKIRFPSGAIAVIGTGVTNDSTNPLKIGVEMDGIWFRPKG